MANPIRVHRLRDLSADGYALLLRRAESDIGPFLDKVRPIVDAVKAEGDAALRRFALQFDGASIQNLMALPEDFERAGRAIPPEVAEAIAYAAANIRRFHQDQKPREMWLHEMRPGAFAGERVVPIASVACYVPRGKGSFPSTVLMTAIPARVAGVDDVCILTPPGPDGRIDAATLVAARAAGVERVYTCGGAQAIAAVAYGTETVPRCAKVVGPGSPWVVAAKRLLSDILDTGPPAGPSESVIFADGSADGRLAVLDLLIEAEHGPDSSAFIVTDSARVADEAQAAIPNYWAKMSEQRVAYTREVLGSSRGGILLAADVEEALAFINDFAPEHLQILSRDPFAYLGRIRNAGEILLGSHTPSTLGNFVLGPSHVLPTAGWARTASALSVHDFLKRISIGYVTRDGYPELARHAGVFARYEGFDAHANSVSELRDGLIAE